MSERAPAGAERNEAEAGARERSHELHGFVYLAPRGRGGGRRAVCPGTSRAKARGRERAGASGGRVGEMENSSCSVALLGCFVDLIPLYYSFAYCIRILCQILYFGNPTAVLLYRIFPNQIAN